MIIDAHAHAAREYADINSILEIVKKYSIEKILICPSIKNNLNLPDAPKLPVRKTPDSNYFLNKINRFAYRNLIKDNGDGNKFVFDLSNKFDLSKISKILIQFLWVNPIDFEHMNNIERNIRNYNVKGIKLHQAWNPFKIESPEFNKLVEVAKSYHLPIFIHLYSKKETHHFVQFIKNNQDVTFIVAHLLGIKIFYEHISYLKNIYFDTSGGYVSQGKNIQEAINLFGFEHVVFGSDMPFEKIGEQLKKIDQLNLSENVKEHVFELNIKNILALN